MTKRKGMNKLRIARKLKIQIQINMLGGAYFSRSITVLGATVNRAATSGFILSSFSIDLIHPNLIYPE